jgi:hypothetical protein
MPEFGVEMPDVTTLAALLLAWQADTKVDLSYQVMDDLRARLYAREDNMADLFRLAGVQFGLFPQIVAEVLAEAGLGTPIDDAERLHIRRNFAVLMERLREEHERGEHG